MWILKKRYDYTDMKRLTGCTLFCNLQSRTGVYVTASPWPVYKGRGTCSSGKRNAKIWIAFRKSPRFSLTSPLSQLREKSSRPVFTMYGEPKTSLFDRSWAISLKPRRKSRPLRLVWWALPPRYNWNIVESGVKHHQEGQKLTFIGSSHLGP
jgi:hypothetical protein